MDESIKVVAFLIGSQRYGIPVQNVLGIEKMQPITEVPQTSDFIKGIINLRGEITPALDLKQRLRLGVTEHAEETRILIVTMNDMQVGLIVDAATDVMTLDTNALEDAPEMTNGISTSFIEGVANLEDNLLILLNLEYILDFTEVNEVNEMIDN
ncbi:chemotaxis protein CheW [Barrientosiimonas marina]|uniref:Chemotaxis protein CheW n=1 Tax=Lentibacillus kimchii TaxID=1542911 RepID=A0ABW2UYU4_9BACI